MRLRFSVTSKCIYIWLHQFSFSRIESVGEFKDCLRELLDIGQT
jgi:hypothetical protein